VHSDIQEDEFVARLVADPDSPPSAFMVMGYVGKSPREECIRLYVDAHLSAHVDIPRALVLHAIKIPQAVSALGGSYIWVKAEPSMVQALAQAFAQSAQAQRRVWQT
jgi:hypothetical protein